MLFQEDVITAEIGISVGTAKNKKLSNEATDPDYRPEREKQGPPKPIELPSPEKSESDKIDFSGRWISKTDVERALAYYRGTKKRTRSIESMNHRFKWIKDKHHITKLLKFEKQGIIIELPTYHSDTICKFRCNYSNETSRSNECAG